MKKPTPAKARIFRQTDPGFFPDPAIIAVHDQVDNIVFFNSTYAGNETLERRALFMLDPVLRARSLYQ